jgi:hypothetical protein
MAAATDVRPVLAYWDGGGGGIAEEQLVRDDGVEGAVLVAVEGQWVRRKRCVSVLTSVWRTWSNACTRPFEDRAVHLRGCPS